MGVLGRTLKVSKLAYEDNVLSKGWRVRVPLEWQQLVRGGVDHGGSLRTLPPTPCMFLKCPRMDGLSVSQG